MAKKRRKTRSRKAAARKAAATRSRKRATRSRAAKKAARTRRRRRSRPAARRRPSRRRRSRSRSRVRGRKHRPVVYKRRGRFYQKRRGKLGLKGHRVNPPLIPSLGSVMGIVKDGAAGVAGYVGVNAVLTGANMLGLNKLYANQSPVVQGLIKTLIRALAVPLVAKVGGMVLKGEGARRALLVGAATNVVIHGIKDIAGDQVPSWGQDLLLGDGTGDYLTASPNLSDFLPGPAGGPGANALVAASAPGAEGLF